MFYLKYIRIYGWYFRLIVLPLMVVEISCQDFDNNFKSYLINRKLCRKYKVLFETIFNFFFVFLFCENKKNCLKIIWLTIFKNYFKKKTFKKCNLENKKQEIRFRCFQLFYKKH